MTPRIPKNLLFVLMAVFLSGIALSIGLSWASLQIERAKQQGEIQEHLVNHLVSIETTLRSSLYVLDALAAYFDSDEAVGRSEFHTFATSLLRGRTTIQALEWIPRVPSAERRHVEEMAHRDGFSEHGFTERDPQGRMVPAGERGEYFPVYNVEPLSGNEPAVLFDLGSDATRLAALDTARDTGHAVATERVVLVQEKGDQYGFIVFRAVYRKGAHPRTVEERRQNLAGFVVAVFRIGTIVQRAMAPLHSLSRNQHMQARIFDMTAAVGERLVYPKGETVADPANLPHDIHAERSFDVAGRHWVLMAFPTAAFEQSKNIAVHWIILGAGLVVMVLLIGFVGTTMQRRVDRQAAARFLQESENLLRSFLDNSPNATVLKDINGRYLIANAAFLELVNASEGKWADKTFADLSPDDPEYRRSVAEHEREVVESRLPVVKEREWRGPNGSLGTYIITKFPILDDAGKVIRIGSISTDISARKRAERKLHDLNRAYRTLSRCNEILVRSESEETLIASVCRTIVETGGYAGAVVGITEFGGLGPIRLVSQFGLPETTAPFQIPWDDPNCPIVAAVKTHATQVIGSDADASTCGLFLKANEFKQMAAFPLVSGGWAIGVLAVFSGTPDAFGKDALALLEELAGDMAFGITALRSKADHEKALVEMRKLTRAVEQSPAMIIVTDAEGTIEYVNPKFIEVTGYSLGQAAGAKPSLLKSGEMETKEYANLWKAIRGGEEWRGLFHNKRKDGSFFWAETAISPILDGDGKVTHFIGIQEDVTERLNAERRLRHADKMDSLGNLAGGIAHDFNNMLLPIGTLTEMVLKEMEPGSKGQKRLERVLEATKRAQSLAQQILAFGRTDEGQIQTLGIAEITLETVNLLKSTLSKTITLDVRIEPHLGVVECDRAQIETVILNLAKNAADAMERKPGNLRIALKRVHLTVPLKGQASTILPGSYACLTLSDTGKGIEPDKLARIFEPYFTTKAKGEGTGLGLAMVRTVILKHGGEITVESQVGVGTTFRLYFPLLDAATEPAAA